MRYRSGVQDPGLIANWTILGSMGLTQDGDTILATTNKALANCAVQAIPGGQVSSKLWTIAAKVYLAGASLQTYPEIGVCITDGTSVAGGSESNYYAMTRYSNSFGWHALTGKVNTLTRTIYTEISSNHDYIYKDGFDVRILSESANIYFQCGDGRLWRTFDHRALPGGTLGYFGFLVGGTFSTGLCGGRIAKCKVSTPVQFAIASVTGNLTLATFTTTTPHGMGTGYTVAANGITGTGTLPNLYFDSSVIVTGATTFTVPDVSTFSANANTGTLTVLSV